MSLVAPNNLAASDGEYINAVQLSWSYGGNLSEVRGYDIYAYIPGYAPEKIHYLSGATNTEYIDRIGTNHRYLDGSSYQHESVRSYGTYYDTRYYAGPYLYFVKAVSEKDSNIVSPSSNTDFGYSSDGIIKYLMSGSSLNDTINGNDQINAIQSYAGNDSISGLGGNDIIEAGSGNNTVYGGSGSDYITVTGSGSNYLRGDVDNATDGGNDNIVGGGGFDDINGNMGNDTLSGGDGTDWVVGGKDNDSLSGGADYDLVYGNLGNDTCNGDDGDDIVRGGQGNDIVNGGAGNDYVSGDKGDDTMTGGAGADIFHSFGDAGIDRVTDFSLAQGDRVQLDPGTVFTLSQVGADTVINMTGGGQMTLVGIQLSALTPGWIFGA